MNLLNHVAIIMDGNGRWGIKNKNFEKNIQKLTDQSIENIEKILSEKEKEIIQI